jgi:hypothetical protein
MDVEPKRNLASGLAILERLKREGRLAPIHEEWIDKTKSRLADLRQPFLSSFRDSVARPGMTKGWGAA